LRVGHQSLLRDDGPADGPTAAAAPAPARGAAAGAARATASDGRAGRRKGPRTGLIRGLPPPGSMVVARQLPGGRRTIGLAVIGLDAALHEIPAGGHDEVDDRHD